MNFGKTLQHDPAQRDAFVRAACLEQFSDKRS
jgi:hypothetical protein